MANQRTATHPMFRSSYAWFIVACGMLFYCFNYFLRISPSVMKPELSQAFHITATNFGMFAAFYYWAYDPMQIPAGMIYDKFGVRVVLSVACLIAVAGLSIFVATDSLAIASAGRFLIGLGCAFSYLGTLKLASIWLPPNRFATAAGCATAIGMISGALAQKYLIHVVPVIGYKQALHQAVIFGVMLSIILAVMVRNRPKDSITGENEMQTPMDVRQLLTALKLILLNKQMWLIGLIGCLLYLPSSVFLDCYGIDYLKTVYGLTPEEAVNVSSITFYGWIIAGPLIGFVSDKIRRRRLPLTGTGFFAALLLCVVFYIPGLHLYGLYAIFFAIGFCCGAHPLCFALAKETNPIQVSGTSVAVTNMLIMLGGVVFQPVVGMLLDFHNSGVVGGNGLPIYTASDYTFGLSVVPIGVALGIFLSVFLRETYCQSQAVEEELELQSAQLQAQPAK